MTRKGSHALLCALDELDDAGDDGDDEPDGAQHLEERAETAHPDRGLADLLADLARICASCCQRPSLFKEGTCPMLTLESLLACFSLSGNFLRG